MTHELTPTLIAVEVLETAYKAKVSGTNSLCIKYSPTLLSEWIAEQKMPEGCWKVLGFCTKDHIDFDVEPYVTLFTELGYYTDYTNPDVCLPDVQSSYRSLLESKGLYFVNPYNEKVKVNPDIQNSMVRTINRRAYADKWQEAENKLVKKLVILEKI